MTSGRPSLNIFEKRRLAMTGDDSMRATGIRLRAVRLTAGMDVDDLAREAHEAGQHVIDCEAGLLLPKWGVTYFFRRRWRIPDEFILDGQISLLPADVEPHIFARLS